jgi:para-nitrobenzyl esterase
VEDEDLVRQVRALLPRRARERAGEVISVYRTSRTERGLPATNHDIVDAVSTGSMHRTPSVRVAEAQRAHQPATYLYQFDQESPIRRLGACHGLEIPFVFGVIGRGGDDRMSGDSPAVHELSGKMMDAWISFIRSGDPAHPGIGDWPAYDPSDRWTMVFGPETGAQRAPFEEERSLWASLISGGSTHREAAPTPVT